MKTNDKIIVKLLILFALIILKGCYLISASPDVLIQNDFTGENIGVLNFATQGDYIPSDIGRTAADKLTDALFIEGKFSVIDRAEVNDAQLSLEIKSPELLSADEIQRMGAKLGANYIVLGRIQNIDANKYFGTDYEKELNISFRIISVLDSSVKVVATYSSKYNGNINQEIQDMLYEIVRKLRSV